MTYECPKCKRLGMEWDGRAKVIMCYFNTCNHVIRMLRADYRGVPTEKQIQQAIVREGLKVEDRENPVCSDCNLNLKVRNKKDCEKCIAEHFKGATP